MAQHISILENKMFPKVTEAIQNRFAKKNIGLSSLWYEELKSNDYKFDIKSFLVQTKEE